MIQDHPTVNIKIPVFLLMLVTLFVGCGKKEDSTSTEFAPIDNTDEVQNYYQTKVNLPPSIFEELERGTITQEELDARIAAGEFPKFFRFATPEDIPSHLEWVDGSELPDIGDPDAVKGGIRYANLQDFPRTLRVIGPDSNGSFRPFLLDDTSMEFAHRHPNITSIGKYGHEYFPGVAKEWAIDKANKTVYVRLNPEARWSDGVPITTDDVFFMFFMYQSKYINAPWYNNWYNRNYTNVTKYDEHTFSISVPEAKPDMNARVLELRAMPRHFYKEMGDDFVQRYQWRFQPTSGPYIIEDGNIQKGRFIRLTRNDNWWAKDNKFWRNRFNYDVIHFTVVRDSEKAFELFKKGEIDRFGMNLAKYNYDKLPDEDPLVQNGYIAKYTFYNDRPRPTYGLWINQAKPLLDNRDIREGINYASNWKTVIDKYFRGDYVRMRTTADGYDEFTHPSLEARPFDVTKALEYFAKAGFTERGDDGILRNEEGQRLSFTVTTGYEALEDLLIILKEEALKAGLEFRLEVLDSTAGWKKAQEKQHEIMFSAFGVSPEMYPRYWETYHSVNAYDTAFLPNGSVNPERKPKPQTNNLQSIADPSLDKLIEAYRASENAAEMMQLAYQMEEILYEDASFVPGFVMPFFRWAAWRWNKFPDDGNVKLADAPDNYFVGWIDTDLKEEVEAAMKANKPLPKILEIHDQYNAYKAKDSETSSN
jgi:microcin C transport system substrate-binding protein